MLVRRLPTPTPDLNKKLKALEADLEKIKKQIKEIIEAI